MSQRVCSNDFLEAGFFFAAFFLVGFFAVLLFAMRAGSSLGESGNECPYRIRLSIRLLGVSNGLQGKSIV